MMATRMVRIGYFPARSGNPYLRLFYAALERRGVATAVGIAVSDLPGVPRRADLDIVHLHWNVERLWHSERPAVIAPGDPRFRLRRWLHRAGVVRGERSGLEACADWLRHLRRAGRRVVWTVHELEPPEAGSPLDRDGHALLARHADLLLCHSEHTRREILQRWSPACPIEVMAIGNYDEVFSCASSQPATLRRRFGLDADRPVVAPFSAGSGATRAWTWRRAPLRHWVLPCRWSSPEPSLAESCAARGRGVHQGRSFRACHRSLALGRGVLRVGCAADLLVLRVRIGHRERGADGGVLDGSRRSRVDLPYFREVAARHGDAMRLVGTEDPDALARGIIEMLQVPSAARTRAARAAADRTTWDSVVEPFVRSAILRT